MAKKSNPAATIRLAARHLMPTYQRPPVVFTRGKGCWVWDHRGRKYLDFLGGIAVNALGHAHPRLVRVVQREAARAIHMSNLFHNPYQGPLAAKLATCSGLDRVFFTNSGTEAIEGALKLARLFARKKTGMDAPPTKTRILALENSFHGRTFGAVAITANAKYREPYAPVLPGAEFIRFNDVADLEDRFSDDVCAVVLETIQGEGGIHAVSEAFWNRTRELCTLHDSALIADEIQCGLGRTGRWFAYAKFTAKPDIVAVAKPLAGGLPLGAFLASEKFASAFAPGLHGTTFGGGPMICAAALEFLQTVEEEKLMANVRARGEELRAGLARLAARFDFIREVRGEGLMLGVELAVEGKEYARQALKRGLIINCTHDRVLRLLPPFVIGANDVKEFLARFETVLARTPRPQPAANDAPRARAAAH
jgi:acetylornithine aminotransferase/acetylornithine/N-succinyldiaminopimelate aminotransferase